jgi:hypothetical protein
MWSTRLLPIGVGSGNNAKLELSAREALRHGLEYRLPTIQAPAIRQTPFEVRKARQRWRPVLCARMPPLAERGTHWHSATDGVQNCRNRGIVGPSQRSRGRILDIKQSRTARQR